MDPLLGATDRASMASVSQVTMPAVGTPTRTVVSQVDSRVAESRRETAPRPPQDQATLQVVSADNLTPTDDPSAAAQGWPMSRGLSAPSFARSTQMHAGRAPRQLDNRVAARRLSVAPRTG